MPLYFGKNQIDNVNTKVEGVVLNGEPAGTAQALVAQHNNDANAHSDIRAAVANLEQHTLDAANPHNVTKEQIGLSNVDNTSDMDKPVSTAQATAIADAKQASLDAQSELSDHIDNQDNPHNVTKEQIGLENVENKSVSEILSEMTSDDVTNALGYVPMSEDAEVALKSDIPSIEGLASTSYVDTQLAALVNSAPDKLNTLDELAAALGDDENFANTVTTQIADKVGRTELPSAIESALTTAKESGEFDGKTPVRGTDYWTDADKAEIKSYVDEAILGGAW